jgi:hypothetical protein
MKKSLPPNLEKFRGNHPHYVEAPEGSIEGYFLIQKGNKRLQVISGCGDGWDHVSVSLPHRCPTWEEMNWVKNRFFEDEEMVIQLHPPKSKYINIGKYVLHMWRPWHQEIELPPRWMMVPDNLPNKRIQYRQF